MDQINPSKPSLQGQVNIKGIWMVINSVGSGLMILHGSMEHRNVSHDYITY